MSLTDKEILKKFNLTEEKLGQYIKEADDQDFTSFEGGNIYHYQPQKECNVTISFTLPKSQSDLINKISKDKNISRSSFLREAVKKEILMSL